MKKLNHAPGPWRSNGMTCVIDANNETLVAFVNGNVYRKNYKEDNTNALLTAAAPEMLEALIDLYDDWKNIDHIDPDAMIKPLIERATGYTWEELKKD